LELIASSYFQGADNKEYSSMLYKALEGAVMLHTFPKTTVDVFALVLESGGSMILF
jgi:exosome complex component MTR3